MPVPMPRETLTRLLCLNTPVQFIYGNGEIAVLEQMAGRDSSSVPEQHRPVVRWTAQQLDATHRQALASWPRTTSIEIPELGDVLFCHATPRNENELFTRLTPESRLLHIFEGLDVSVVICGHTHMQFDRMVGRVRVVNAGNVGMPFGTAAADWLLLGSDIEFRHTDYDLAKAAGQIRSTSYPQAQDFADNNVLRPPSEMKMLDLFARAELK